MRCLGLWCQEGAGGGVDYYEEEAERQRHCTQNSENIYDSDDYGMAVMAMLSVALMMIMGQ